MNESERTMWQVRLPRRTGGVCRDCPTRRSTRSRTYPNAIRTAYLRPRGSFEFVQRPAGRPTPSTSIWQATTRSRHGPRRPWEASRSARRCGLGRPIYPFLAPYTAGRDCVTSTDAVGPTTTKNMERMNAAYVGHKRENVLDMVILQQGERIGAPD